MEQLNWKIIKEGLFQLSFFHSNLNFFFIVNCYSSDYLILLYLCNEDSFTVNVLNVNPLNN